MTRQEIAQQISATQAMEGKPIMRIKLKRRKRYQPLLDDDPDINSLIEKVRK